jgi:hypothetical protein
MIRRADVVCAVTGLVLIVVGAGWALGDEQAPFPTARAQASAEEAVLTTAQLPDGFTRETVTGTGNLPCGNRDLRDVAPDAAVASALFQGGRGRDTHVYTEVLVLGSRRAAEELYSALVEAGRSCSMFTYAEEGESQEISIRVEVPVSRGTWGAQSFAVETFEGSLPGRTWVRHALYIQDGPSIAAVTGASYSKNDARRIAEYAAPAVARRLPGRHALSTDEEQPIEDDTRWWIPLITGTALLVTGATLWISRRGGDGRARP